MVFRLSYSLVHHSGAVRVWSETVEFRENYTIHVGNQLKMSLIGSSTNWQKYETNNLIMGEFPEKHRYMDLRSSVIGNCPENEGQNNCPPIWQPN